MRNQVAMHELGCSYENIVYRFLFEWMLMLSFLTTLLVRQSYLIGLLSVIVFIIYQELHYKYKNCCYCKICQDTIQIIEVRGIKEVLQLIWNKRIEVIELKDIKEIQIHEPEYEVAFTIVCHSKIRRVALDGKNADVALEEAANYLLAKGLSVCDG